MTNSPKPETIAYVNELIESIENPARKEFFKNNFWKNL